VVARHGVHARVVVGVVAPGGHRAAGVEDGRPGEAAVMVRRGRLGVASVASGKMAALAGVCLHGVVLRRCVPPW